MVRPKQERQMGRTKILITGSDGFIGSHVYRSLAQDYEVKGYDRKSGQELFEIEELNYTPDFIVHLAGSCSTSLSLDDPISDFEDNLAGTLSVLEFARRHKSKLIHTSTCKARSPVKTPYGVSKRASEMYINDYMNSFQLKAIINRPGTVYGEGQEGSEESGWVAWFIKAKKRDIPIKIHGDGSQMRDLLHVSDYVSLIREQIELFNLYKGRTYDIGGGWPNAVSVKELADYLGLEYKHTAPRIGDTHVYVAENGVPGKWRPSKYWKDNI